MEGPDQWKLFTQGCRIVLRGLTILLQHLFAEGFWVIVCLREGYYRPLQQHTVPFVGII